MGDTEPTRSQFDETKFSRPEMRAVARVMFNIAQLKQILLGNVDRLYEARTDQQKNDILQGMVSAAEIIQKRLGQNIQVLRAAVVTFPENSELKNLLDNEVAVLNAFDDNLGWAVEGEVLRNQVQRFTGEGLGTYIKEIFDSMRTHLDAFSEIELVKETKEEMRNMGITYVDLPHYRGLLPNI